MEDSVFAWGNAAFIKYDADNNIVMAFPDEELQMPDDSEFIKVYDEDNVECQEARDFFDEYGILPFFSDEFYW